MSDFLLSDSFLYLIFSLSNYFLCPILFFCFCCFPMYDFSCVFFCPGSVFPMLLLNLPGKFAQEF